jgi:hypothetical protein
MLLDHRTYTVRPGCLRKQLALYEKHGLAVQRRHFGEPLAWLVAETGDVNSYVDIWVYDDAADRARKRAAMMADPEWQAYPGDECRGRISAAAGIQADVAGQLCTDPALTPA